MRRIVRIPISLSIALLLLLGCKKESTQLDASSLPTILSYSDSLLAPKATVTLVGKNFSPNSLENQVLLNGTQLATVALNTTTLYVAMPGYFTAGNLKLYVRGVLAVGLQPHVVVNVNKPGGRPTINSLSKLTGKIGDTLTVYGVNFDTLPSRFTPANLRVSIGGGYARVLYATPTQLTVQVSGGSRSGTLTLNTAGFTVTGPQFTVTPSPANQRLLWLVTVSNIIYKNNYPVSYPFTQQLFAGKTDGSTGVNDRAFATIPVTKSRYGEDFRGADLFAVQSQNRIYYTNKDSGRVGIIHLDNPSQRDTLYRIGNPKDSLTIDSNRSGGLPFFSPFQVAVDPGDPLRADSLYILAGAYTVSRYGSRSDSTFLLIGSTDGSKQLHRLPLVKFPLIGNTAPFPNNTFGLEVVNGTYYIGILGDGIYAGPVDGSLAPVKILDDNHASAFVVSRATNTVYWISTGSVIIAPIGYRYQYTGIYSSPFNGISPLSPPAAPLVSDTTNSPARYGLLQGTYSTNNISLAIIPSGVSGSTADQLYWINSQADAATTTSNGVGLPGAIWEYDLARPATPPAVVYLNPQYTSPINLTPDIGKSGTGTSPTLEAGFTTLY